MRLSSVGPGAPDANGSTCPDAVGSAAAFRLVEAERRCIETLDAGMVDILNECKHLCRTALPWSRGATIVAKALKLVGDSEFGMIVSTTEELAEWGGKIADEVRNSCARIAEDAKAKHLMMFIGYRRQVDLLEHARIVECLRDYAKALHAGDLDAVILLANLRERIAASGLLHPMAPLLE